MRKSICIIAPLLGALAGCGSGSGAPAGSFASPSPSARGAFVDVGALATGRRGHTATFVERLGKVVVVGGIGRAGAIEVTLDSAELFDPATLAFTPSPARLDGGGAGGPSGRAYHAAVELPSGEILVIGGQSDIVGARPLASLERFDPTGMSVLAAAGARGSPTTSGSAVQGRLGEPKAEPVALACSTPSGGREVVIAGGRAGPDRAALPLASVDAYDAETNTVVAVGASLPAPLFGARAMPMLEGDASGAGPWMIAGGVSDASAFGFTIFDPATRSFHGSPVHAAHSGEGNLFEDRAGFDAAVLGGAAIALFGGRGGLAEASPPLDTIESYDAPTGTWLPAGERLHIARQGHTATALESGEVLVVGGTGPSGEVLASAELVSGAGPDAVVTPLATSLRVARTHHTATPVEVVVGGRIVVGVLIVGGEDARGDSVAAAELFLPE